MILKSIYKLTHPDASKERIPYVYRRSLFTQIVHSLRKWAFQVVAPNCIFNFTRVTIYRLGGIKIGKGTFIGMKCYMDDLCADKIVIGNNVTISYGVYFACHGKKQGHNRIVIKDGAYIGMRASVIAPKGDVEIGEDAIVGTMALVNKSIPSGKTAVGVPCRIINTKE